MPIVNYLSFSSDLDELQDLARERMQEINRDTATRAITKLVDRTTGVEDTRRLIENWQVTTNSIPDTENRASDPLARGLSEIRDVGPFDIVHNTNLVPYGDIYELGSFEPAPSPGGRVEATGYHVEAPDGFVQVTALELYDELD